MACQRPLFHLVCPLEYLYVVIVSIPVSFSLYQKQPRSKYLTYVSLNIKKSPSATFTTRYFVTPVRCGVCVCFWIPEAVSTPLMLGGGLQSSRDASEVSVRAASDSVYNCDGIGSELASQWLLCLLEAASSFGGCSDFFQHQRTGD